MPHRTPPPNARVLHDAQAALPTPHGRVVVVGNFDGVHRGHQAVLEAAAVHRHDAAGPRELAVLTFEPHPAAVLGASPPPRLTRLSRKVELLTREGVDLIVAQRFDPSFAALLPEAFARNVLADALRAAVVVVGHDFRFGARRAGDLPALQRFGKQLGFFVEVQPEVADARGALSSTRVRASLAAGDLDDVTAVLGRPHALSGVVVTGDRRGRTLGFPTANLGDVEEAFPAFGVYAVLVDLVPAIDCSDVDGPIALAAGVANIGLRPTVTGGGGHPSIEVHMFDLPEAYRDLYGQSLRIHLVGRIREERRFAGLDALKAQIAADAAKARELTAGAKPGGSGAFG